MKKPRIYKSDLLLENLINKSNKGQIKQYIKSLYKYIDLLESYVDIDELLNEENENMEDEE